MSNDISVNPKKILGGRIKALRAHLGLTLEAFADPLSVKGASVNDYEHGRAKASEAIIREMETHYRLNRVWYETGEGDMLKSAADTSDEQSYPPGKSKYHQLTDAIVKDAPPDFMALSPRIRRMIEEMKKMTDEEQDEELRRVIMENLGKGRY